MLASLGLTVSAEQRRGEVRLVRPPTQAVKFAGTWPEEGNGATRVIGTVIDIRQIPVINANVQLRDLKTGAVVAKADTNANGEYEFEIDSSGTYVVEMVMVDNSVIALSNAGSVSRAKTLNTVIQLPGRWDLASRSMSVPVAATAFFGIGSTNSLTSATIQLAADNNLRPIDAGEPVSPR